MQKIFTLSAYETTAQDFFDTIISHDTDLVLDVRLRNESQLCGFTKKRDLEYFIPLITHAVYIYEPRFAPSPELLVSYTGHRINFDTYASSYRELMEQRGAGLLYQQLCGSYKSVCILGTAVKKRRSHSEILASIVHIDGGDKYESTCK